MTRESPLSSAAPQAEVPRTDFDFGVMNPLTEGRHDFVIRNAGNAPLRLQVGPTSCKCTVSGLAKKELAPGEETTMTLEWNTGRDVAYSHAGTIYTNDPQRKHIDFRVHGTVRALIVADAERIAFPAIEPGQPATAELLLYSQIWDQFTVVGGETGLEGLTWELEPVSEASVPQLEARSVQRLRVSLPGTLPKGEFTDRLQLTVQVPGEVNVHHVELPVHGRIAGRLAMYGPLLADGEIDLGNLKYGQGKKTKLIVKIRGEDGNLDNAKLTVHPALVQARLAKRSEGASGLYDLTLEVPADTEPCQFKGGSAGKLTFDSGREDVGVVELHLTFAVMPRS